MANLSRTLFGRLYGLKMDSHFYKHSRTQSWQHGIYQEHFKMGPDSLISGELYYKYAPYGPDYDNKYYFEKSFVVISIDGTNNKYVEKRKQEYDGTDVLFDHQIYLVKNKSVLNYEPIDFAKIPKSIIELLDKKNDKHIIKCSCHHDDLIPYIFR